MIAMIAGAWGWLNSKFLHACIFVGVAAMVLWQVFLAGVNKQKVNQYEKEKDDADKRNKISAEVDASSPDANRDKLRDRWSAR